CSMPALLKGFYDRILLPGWAFKYHKTGVLWDRLLKGRSARLIVTSDSPALYNRIVHRNSPIRISRNMILKFCGFDPVKVTTIGSVRHLSDSKRRASLAKIQQLGQHGK
ncbi:MAG: flavodoxin family protein, partial [Cyanothece sp. SIO1E1]|nr:flavodoxin family protein [Cyanothece sp. SIO1E1]